VRSSSGYSTTYRFSARFRLPFNMIFGETILALDTSWSPFSLYRNPSIENNNSLSIRTVVSDEAEIMAACRQGNLQKVYRLFIDGKARPFDVTASNSTPLRVGSAFD